MTWLKSNFVCEDYEESDPLCLHFVHDKNSDGYIDNNNIKRY